MGLLEPPSSLIIGLKSYDSPLATVFDLSIKIFQDVIKPSTVIKHLSLMIDFGGLRIGQLCDLPIIGQ